MNGKLLRHNIESMQKRDGMINLSVTVVTILLCSILLSQISVKTTSAQLPLIPLVSTREHFRLDSGELRTDQHNTTDYTHLAIPGLDGGSECPPEVAIYIHGVWASESGAIEQADRTRLSLFTDHYKIPVIGYTWDSNTAFSPDDLSASEHGWKVAKKIADQNGPKLAHFLIDYLTTCKLHHQDIKIRVIGHSLAARVIFSSLLNLDKNTSWNSNGFKITSVDLLGAAIGENVPSKGTLVGHAITNVVIKFYNLYDPRDVMLLKAYGPIEGSDALGLTGAYSVSHPSNYIEQDVASFKMQLQDANGTAQPDCLDREVPFSMVLTYFGWISVPTDNHCGYMGFRDQTNWNSIRSDGAMSTVISGWRE
jgi:hypothetical protein